MDKINYTDGMLLHNLISCACNNANSSSKLISYIDSLINRIEIKNRKEDRYWSYPNGKKLYVNALKQLLHLVSIETSSDIIKAFEHDVFNISNGVEKKCKVIIFVQEYSVWPSMESVYKAIKKDKENLEVHCVYVPFRHSKNDKLQAIPKEYKEIDVISYDKFDLASYNPDIMFFSKPYYTDYCVPKGYRIDEIEEVCDRFVYIPYGMEINYSLIRYGFQEYMHYKAWRHIMYGEIAKRVGTECGYRNGENLVVWGHPKADAYITDAKCTVPPAWADKIRNRKVILWCPHHTIQKGPESCSTWLKYQTKMFDYFSKHKNIVLLWRPHPLLFPTIVTSGYMTKKELDDFLNNILMEDNIILDTTEDYYVAFKISDAIISDGTTFSIEYLYTGKPLMLTTEKDKLKDFYENENIKKGLYVGLEFDDIKIFINNIIEEKDPLKRKRKSLASEMLYIPQGLTVGENICRNILLDLEKDCIVKL